MADTTSATSSTAGMTRQQMYDRIRETSKEEFILDGMIRLGFWPQDQSQPNLPAELIRRRGELERELSGLMQQNRLFEDKERALREMRKQRLMESKKKQEETKKRREQQRKDKAEAWKAKKEKEIVYLGKNFSYDLNHTENRTERLSRFDLPVFGDAAALAAAMNIPLGALRFLAFSRKVSRVSHYKRFYLPKKSGGKRLISAPMPRLKKAQHWILENILQKVTIHDAAHGFVPKRSMLSNAQQHVGRAAVVNIDLKDFFPTVSYRRVKGMFVALGYSAQIATILSLICTEPEIDEVKLDGQSYFMARSERFLPQGAPTSPMITNILCHRLDRRLKGVAGALGFAYSRYADDMTFSVATDQGIRNINKLMWSIRQVIEKEGFIIHPDKIRIMRKGSRQEVTGIVVNEKPAVDRQTLRKFRALLFQVEKDGPEGKKWGNTDQVLAAMTGFAGYVKMVDQVKGQPLVEQVQKLIARYPVAKPVVEKKALKEEPVQVKEQVAETTRPLTEEKPWWKLW